MTDTVICVGAVVQQADRLLLVRQSSGHSLAGRWTIPWGRLESGESPSAAVRREVAEEGGVEAEVQGLLGVQELPEPWLGMIGLLYLCRHVSGDALPACGEVDAAAYFASADLAAVEDALEPLSAWLATRFFLDELSLLPLTRNGPFAPSAACF